MENKLNEICITKTAATVLELLGLQRPMEMADSIREVIEKADEVFPDRKCDRVFLYHPDAVAMWIYEKYRAYFNKLEGLTDVSLPMLSVVPPVTPVCFGSMYSGLLPAAHGIMKYVKPVLQVKTVFDVLADAGKRAAIVSTKGDSISLIFLERNIDYFIYSSKEECNQKAMELIRQDQHDLIVLYNGDYDYYMHRFTPEGKRPLRALRENIETYMEINRLIRDSWKGHRTVTAFAPDHGCHRMCLLLGNHGVEKSCDMNIMHFYSFINGQQCQAGNGRKE